MARPNLSENFLINTQGRASPSVPTSSKSNSEKKKTVMNKLLGRSFRLTELEEEDKQRDNGYGKNVDHTLVSEAVPTSRPYKAHPYGNDTSRFTTSEYSWPIILVIFPPVVSTFYGDAQTWSDLLLLILVGFYLFLIIKVPWELYFVARKKSLNMVSLAGTPIQPRDAAQEAIRFEAEQKLRRQEKLAFLVVIISPMLGGYLLHTAKGYLTQFDRYFSQLNIMIFIFATGVKPITFLVSLVKKRALMLQEEIHYPVGEVEGLRRRVGLLENELNQLRKAYATKLEMGQVRDGVEPTLIQLSRVLQRYDRREQKIRAMGEERLARLEEKLTELEYGANASNAASNAASPVNNSESSFLGFLLACLSTFVFWPVSIANSSLKLVRYFLPSSGGKSTPLIQSLDRRGD